MKMIHKVKTYGERKTFPDESFISCLCCIPRAWILFTNDQWTRVFESHDEGLKLIKEFRRGNIVNISEPVSFIDKISLWLDESVWNDEFDHLIIVAPAHTLRIINKSLSPPVLARTIAEVDWPIVESEIKRAQENLPIYLSACD